MDQVLKIHSGDSSPITADLTREYIRTDENGQQLLTLLPHINGAEGYSIVQLGLPFDATKPRESIYGETLYPVITVASPTIFTVDRLVIWDRYKGWLPVILNNITTLSAHGILSPNANSDELDWYLSATKFSTQPANTIYRDYDVFAGKSSYLNRPNLPPIDIILACSIKAEDVNRAEIEKLKLLYQKVKDGQKFNPTRTIASNVAHTGADGLLYASSYLLVDKEGKTWLHYITDATGNGIWGLDKLRERKECEVNMNPLKKFSLMARFMPAN